MADVHTHTCCGQTWEHDTDEFKDKIDQCESLEELSKLELAVDQAHTCKVCNKMNFLRDDPLLGPPSLEVLREHRKELAECNRRSRAMRALLTLQSIFGDGLTFQRDD